MPALKTGPGDVLSSKALSLSDVTTIAYTLQLYAMGEREGFARALHNGPMQKLATALMHLAAPDEATQRTGKGLVQEALEDLQSIENDLYTPAFDLLTLPTGLSNRLTQLNARTIKLSFYDEPTVAQVPKNEALPLFLLAEGLARFSVEPPGVGTEGRLRVGWRFGRLTLQATLWGNGYAFAKLADYAPVRNALARLALVGGRYNLREGRILAMLSIAGMDARRP